MDAWKEKLKKYAVYCKEDKRDTWINDLDSLNEERFVDLSVAYENQKISFLKTAEIMKALEEGESWEKISVIIMNGQEYCPYPIGEIGAKMLRYSNYGIEFVEIIIGNAIELLGSLKEEFTTAVAEEKGIIK